jgi:hypothetical protein
VAAQHSNLCQLLSLRGTCSQLVRVSSKCTKDVNMVIAITLNSPDTCSCSYIEDIMKIRVDRCEVQLSLQGQAKEVILEIKTILLAGIIREDIFPILE